ncbi:MAG: tRNA (adenosine(37)-N6)-threonylcarbamoyltransferase complex ATPase subunit type 1 TsaE [Lachnospiraceae bacterium]|nr:tRNA (adenosine(37)-N6)-threonylcarbamoyltransferase complex ATPase subunit type 1 TsaE [Lachnospiraceae bacterium]
MDNRVYESNSPDDTYELGRSIGESITPGSIIALDGDLGAGKTLLTQGLAAGLGITEPVNSPTFTIMQIYESGRLPLYHFDVYRIDDPYEMEEVGFDDFIYGDGVSVIEWPDRIAELMEQIPDPYTEIRITRDDERGFDYRRIEITERS